MTYTTTNLHLVLTYLRAITYFLTFSSYVLTIRYILRSSRYLLTYVLAILLNHFSETLRIEKLKTLYLTIYLSDPGIESWTFKAIIPT